MRKKLKNSISLKISGIWQKSWRKPPLAFEACRSRKVIWNEKKMRPKRTTESKVMAFQSFQISMRILCLSNHLGCSSSLYLLVDLAKTYQNEWSQCSNDQIIKNLWLLELRNLLIQCYTTQYCNGTWICYSMGWNYLGHPFIMSSTSK